MKKLLASLLIGTSLLGLAGCGGSSDEPTAKSETEQSTEKSSEKQSETKSSEKMKTEFKVGQTISYHGVDMKVDEVKYIQPGEYDSLADGEQFVAMKITIKNVDNSHPVDYNPFDFQLSADGNQKDCSEYLSDHDEISNNELESGSLEKGASVTGWLVGTAKSTASKLQLQYTGNIFENESKITINLK